MKNNVTLAVVSLLTLVLIMCHLTDDTIRQVEGSVQYPIPVVVFTVWLFATLVLRERVSGHVIMLLGGIVAAGMIVVHSRGLVVRSSGGFFFTWTLFALSATGWFTAILAACGLWEMFRARRHRRTVARASA